MAPNGDDLFDPDEMNGHHGIETQPRTFREVMEEALEAMQVTAESDACVIDFVDPLCNSSDIPEKAKPFIKQLGEIRKTFKALEVWWPNNEEEIDPRAVSDTIKNVESSCNNLLEASETNPSLKKFSERLCDEVRMSLAMLKEMLGQPEDTESLIAGLNDLFDDDEQQRAD